MSWTAPQIRAATGRASRTQAPRSGHAEWQPARDRRDPVAILREQEAQRIPELIPIRHQRMVETPFTFFRGAAAVMAEDLARTPVSGLRVQACGDAHLLNFGVFATPERRLVFDVNDFDETLPAPFEWDVKRLAASVVVAGRTRGFADVDCEKAGRASVAAYRLRIADAARASHLDAWYARLEVSALVALLDKAAARRIESAVVRKAQRSTSLGALAKLSEVVDGQRRIVDSPPLVEHVAGAGRGVDATDVVRRYRRSLPAETQVLLGRYRPVDWARKVVGVGSVGTDDAVVLLLGDSDQDPIFLQVKEAQRSVLAPFAGRSKHANHGQRVVAGQRLTQQASDIFLGWTRIGERDYYVRQLRDMKGSVPIEKLSAPELVQYARACGAALANGHARSGDAVAIAAYLGAGDRFDRAVGAFAVAYADQTEQDHAAFAAAGSGSRTNER
jgi:uncharacterized protein (DUF2252 family)